MDEVGGREGRNQTSHEVDDRGRRIERKSRQEIYDDALMEVTCTTHVPLWTDEHRVTKRACRFQKVKDTAVKLLRKAFHGIRVMTRVRKRGQ